MDTQQRFQSIKDLLEEHDQGHLLAFWDQLSSSEKQNLLLQLGQLDFSRIDDWVANYVKKANLSAISADLEPAPSYLPANTAPEQSRKYRQATELGRQLISAGKVAAFVVAGGQGTRLGFPGPKGDFPITPVKNKTLFRIFAETLAAAGKKYRTSLAWYIMTSPLNYAETKEIFRSNDYYGLNEKDVFILQQGTLPNFSFDGKILMADKSTISCSPDGHGGSLKALYQSGAINDMEKRGIEYISYFQIDNPLVKIFDSLFIGLHVLDQAQMSSKALVKAGPKERVGNFCLVDGKVTVIEYSDLPDKLAEARNPDGSLIFELGSTAIHIINKSFVEKLNAKGFALPLHRAVKKIPCIDDEGVLQKPTEPNGIKLETFVFDALPLASKSMVLRILRSEEFAPVKNATGVDSPETARKMMLECSAGWLESAGVVVPRDKDGSVDAVIEIAPSFAIEKEDVKAKEGKIPPIKAKDKIYLA